MRKVPKEELLSSLGNLGTQSPSLLTYFEQILNKFRRKSKPFLQQSFEYDNYGTLPDDFDWRKEMPACIQEVRDQLVCGSCYTFASAGFLSDRFCIHTNGHVNVSLSPMDMVMCSFENFGCGGGYLVPTVDFLMKEGLVTEECQPYHPADMYCTFTCASSKTKYEKYFCRQGTVVLATSPEQIKYELMTNGPMMVGLSVYEDFYNYKEGIYHFTEGMMMGGHAMKLVGWGTDTTWGLGLYWICQNQWSDSWGEEGFVRIYAHEIGLDSLALACLPELE
mmetsp:Transcript_31401/g.30750  ORF Transcript_31401/g.30750 Transcript_31401/m.30750 type:complete len:278 (+) Transcript_31401:146-979(+)